MDIINKELSESINFMINTYNFKKTKKKETKLPNSNNKKNVNKINVRNKVKEVLVNSETKSKNKVDLLLKSLNKKLDSYINNINNIDNSNNNINCKKVKIVNNYSDKKYYSNSKKYFSNNIKLEDKSKYLVEYLKLCDEQIRIITSLNN